MRLPPNVVNPVPVVNVLFTCTGPEKVAVPLVFSVVNAAVAEAVSVPETVALARVAKPDADTVLSVVLPLVVHVDAEAAPSVEVVLFRVLHVVVPETVRAAAVVVFNADVPVTFRPPVRLAVPSKFKFPVFELMLINAWSVSFSNTKPFAAFFATRARRA